MIALLLLSLAAPAPEAIGVFSRWGAFRDTGPTRCYAIATPATRSARPAFASISSWPGANVRNQVHVRFSRPRRENARVMLAVDERRFALRAGTNDAWGQDADGDRAIVAAMRSARSMSVESIGADGRPFADVYPLGGAATAIDAAALACIRR